MSDPQIAQEAAFDFVRYASVWEDADILCEALAPSSTKGRILSIASSGDNVLALLTLDPTEIVAADLNPSQLACLELRIASFRELNHEELLRFLGVLPCVNRVCTYSSLSKHLGEAARSFWDKRLEAIQKGIIHCGKFERYLRTFGMRILPLIHSRKKREFFLQNCDTRERTDFYEKEWNTFRWKLLFKIFFSRKIMGKAGRDPAFFDQVEGSVGSKILARTKYALTEISTDTNPYLVYILTGNYRDEALPRYLRPEFHDLIASKLDRIQIHLAPAQDAGTGSYDGFNLSDIFEYMSRNEFIECYGNLLKRANPGARLAYWNMLAPRKLPSAFSEKCTNLCTESRELYQKDKAWFYQAFCVDQVNG